MKYLRMIGVIAVIGLLFAVVVTSITSRPTAGDQVWDKATTVGETDAPNLYIMYTDLMCPYCDVFSRNVLEHWDEFQQYLADHEILFEVRLTDTLYEANGAQSSRDAAEGAYCAARENKFWEFYHGALQALWNDYHSKGIGDSKTSPTIKDMPEDYWLKIGHEAGLSEQFDNCVNNHDTVTQIIENTRKSAQVAQGMPTFKFNKFTTAGFDNKWGWDYVKMYLDAGLSK